MRIIRYQSEFQEPMLVLHRSAIEGFTLGMSQQQDEADLVAVETALLSAVGFGRVGTYERYYDCWSGYDGVGHEHPRRR